jgi:transposase
LKIRQAIIAALDDASIREVATKFGISKSVVGRLKAA